MGTFMGIRDFRSVSNQSRPVARRPGVQVAGEEEMMQRFLILYESYLKIGKCIVTYQNVEGLETAGISS